MRARGNVTWIGVAWVAAVAMLTSSGAFAVSMETLLMPGKVIRAHEKWEKTCSQCHDRSDVHRQTSLCVDCHKGIGADVRAHKGYHGRMANAGVSECRACHTEHKGRDADIVHLSRAQFDHHLTDFPLDGAHSALDCNRCHKQGESWRKAPTACVDCHKADDAHHGQFTQGCGELPRHDELGRGKFDHDKTEFQSDRRPPRASRATPATSAAATRTRPRTASAVTRPTTSTAGRAAPTAASAT